MKIIGKIMIVTAILTMYGCSNSGSDYSPAQGTTVTLTASSSTMPRSTGTPLNSVEMQAYVEGSDGIPIKGVQVTFGSSNSGIAHFGGTPGAAATKKDTDSNGFARVPLYANYTTGAVTIKGWIEVDDASTTVTVY